MSQSVSAFYYIRNNKRRVAVLAVSLAMFFIINYLSMFLLSTTQETFRSVLTETTGLVQYIRPGEAELLSGSDLGEEEKTVQERYLEAVSREFERRREGIKGCPGVCEVYLAQVEYTYISSVVGNYYVEVPLVEEGQIQALLSHMGGELIQGRMPESAGEVVLDVRLVKNRGYALGDALTSNRDTRLVGVIDCGYYFGCGLAGNYYNPMICVTVDGTVGDLRAALAAERVVFDDAVFVDRREGEKELKSDVMDVIESSTQLLFNGFMVIVAVLVILVDISYMRDRRSEWCLYASIGYGRRAIYYSIVRELLFIFGAGILGAVVVSIAAMALADRLVVDRLGLVCQYFLPDTLIQILCAYVALFGIMQFPVRMEIRRIQTIDAIDDDM